MAKNLSTDCNSPNILSRQGNARGGQHLFCILKACGIHSLATAEKQLNIIEEKLIE